MLDLLISVKLRDSIEIDDYYGKKNQIELCVLLQDVFQIGNGEKSNEYPKKQIYTMFR